MRVMKRYRVDVMKLTRIVRDYGVVLVDCRSRQRRAAPLPHRVIMSTDEMK